MNLIRPFVRRPVMTSVFVVLMVFVGIYGYLDLGIALSPKVDLPLVLVITRYSGAGPAEVETVLTKPIEDAVAQVEGIKKIESYSQEGSSVVLVWLEYDVDTAEATLAVSNRVRAIQNTLPEDADDPVIEKYDINAEPFLTLVVTSNLAPERAYDLVEDKIQRRLTQLQGLARAEIQGGIKREIQVYLDPARMIHFGLSVGQVIPGFSEGLQLMSVGSKYRLVLPPELAYGAESMGSAIGPNSVLVFEVELLGIEAAKKK